MEKTLRNLSRATVTGVCSTRNLDLVRSIGADFVVDYTGEDFTHNGRRYDLIFDTVVKHTFSECKSALGPQGNYITTEFSPVLALRGLWTSITGDTRMVPLPARAPSKEDLVFINKLLYDGKVTPVIDSCYSLSEVPDALCYLEKGHARGKIVVSI